MICSPGQLEREWTLLAGGLDSGLDDGAWRRSGTRILDVGTTGLQNLTAACAAASFRLMMHAVANEPTSAIAGGHERNGRKP